MDLSTEKPGKKRKGKLEEDQARTGMKSLPHDIALDIVSRLPISSLMQFRFVSRAWNMLSYDPNLVGLHFSRRSKNNPCLILHCNYPIRNHLYFVELSDQEGNEIVRKIQTPFCDVMPEFNIIGSCNGLLCLSDSLYIDHMYIYNPFTRRYKELPKSRRQFDDQEVLFGFGFHPATNEYKVVKIVYYRNRYNGHQRYGRYRFRDCTRSEVQVFSLNSATWRSIGEVPYLLRCRPSEALVNGRLHWMTQKSRVDRNPHLNRRIISFDLADEQFRVVPRPDCGGLNSVNYHLAVFEGCLSAVSYVHYARFEIWIMKEYDVKESWIKEFNIEDCSMQFMKPQLQTPYRIWEHVFRQRRAQALCVLENGYVLVEYKGGFLVSSGPNDGTCKRLMFRGMPDLFRTVVHVGSLSWIDTPF